MASTGYFEAIGATLVAGRYFSADDAEGRPRVVIIDNTADGARQAPGISRPIHISNVMAKPTSCR